MLLDYVLEGDVEAQQIHLQQHVPTGGSKRIKADDRRKMAPRRGQARRHDHPVAARIRSTSASSAERQVPRIEDRSAKIESDASAITRSSNFATRIPGYGNCAIVFAVPRTDENGRQLKALLDYLLDGDVEAQQIYDSLGISSSTYYRRIKDDDYPNAEELRRVANRFGLSFPDLQVRFGLMTREELSAYIESAPFTFATVTREATALRKAKLSEWTPRSDAPPL
jgi:hypothetical protein